MITKSEINLLAPVYIGEESEAEPVVVVVGRVGETVDYDAVVLSVIHLAHPTVELVVGDRRPEVWLLRQVGYDNTYN